MRHSIKQHTLAAVLSAAAALSMCMPAYAASKDTIPSVKLEVDCGEEPEAGDSVGSVEVKRRNIMIPTMTNGSAARFR